MVEILAGIIVVAIGIAAAIALVMALGGLVFWTLGEIVKILSLPWEIYQRWRKRRLKEQELLAQRAAAVRRAMIRESRAQNGLANETDWSEYIRRDGNYDDENPASR